MYTMGRATETCYAGVKDENQLEENIMKSE